MYGQAQEEATSSSEHWYYAFVTLEEKSNVGLFPITAPDAAPPVNVTAGLVAGAKTDRVEPAGTTNLPSPVARPVS